MRIENLITGGCTLDDQEVEQMHEVNNKLLDAMQDVVLKLIDLRKDAPVSRKAAMATVLHDFEIIIEDEMCEAEDLIREMMPESELIGFAALCESLKASNTAYWESVKKRLDR